MGGEFYIRAGTPAVRPDTPPPQPPISGFANPDGIAINAETNRIFVMSGGTESIVVIDGVTDTIVKLALIHI